MNTILRSVILVLSLAVCLQTNVKAQKVYIPDANFRAWLNINYASCMVGDSIDPTCPAVLNAKVLKINNLGISDLTGIHVFINDTLLVCSANYLTSLPILLPPMLSLDCSSNQITSLPTLPTSLKRFDCGYNQLDSLPSLPASLSTLNCEVNQLTSLPSIPNNLTDLTCGFNKLTSLPPLPTSLLTLKCHNNLLTSLPSLPSSLNLLACAYNLLTSLPTLPTSLIRLICDNNLLTSLPTLPSNLTYLSCSSNQLSNLPPLPSSLTTLYCHQNQLTSLPLLPTSLQTLRCYNNLLTNLPLLPSNLTYLSCSFNPLTNLPPLPSSLTSLYCYYCQLNSLPVLPTSLQILECYNNLLTGLPSLPSNLIYLRCSYNQLTNLPNLPSSLTNLVCDVNQLSVLPTLPSSLQYLECSTNQLTSLPSLPDSLIGLTFISNQITNLPGLPNTLIYLDCSFNPIACLPELNNLTDLYFDNTLINCIPNYGNVINSSPSISSLPLCDLFNSNGCEVLWNIEGTCYLDLDSNCLLSNNEKGYSNQKLNLYKNGILDQQTYTNINGNYDFDTFSNDYYKTEIDTIGLPFVVNCPISGFYLDTITAADSLKYDRDFALKCKGADLAATSIYSLNFRPASLRTVNILAGDLTNFYGLNCSAGVSGTVTITIVGACNYNSTPGYALTPTTAIGNVLTYSIADFGSISYDSTFDFNLLVDTTALIGSQICITVSVATATTELNYNNNQLTQCFTVVGSFDPNDKAVYPATTLDISGNKWLNYTIRFQNTGTAEAEHIYITDTMSNLVDISTFTLLNYSHEPFVQLYNDGLLKFNFPNIHLPDSNTNEPESHGYVQYKIRAKDSLTVGSSIDNTANIYFDFNAPVITNTTSNLLINCNIPTTILNATICEGESYSLNDLEYYYGGVYQQNILTAFGCDSVVELRLTVNTINNTITQSAGTLQTSATATNYQWINCTTGTAIVGASTQAYNPTQSGSYAVIVDYGTCKDTSACYNFSSVGLNEIYASNISIQPNPFNNELKVTLDKNYSGVLEVYNTIGALIYSEKLQNRNVTLNTSTWNAGVYILKVATNDGVVVKKVVKR